MRARKSVRPHGILINLKLQRVYNAVCWPCPSGRLLYLLRPTHWPRLTLGLADRHPLHGVRLCHRLQEDHHEQIGRQSRDAALRPLCNEPWDVTVTADRSGHSSNDASPRFIRQLVRSGGYLGADLAQTASMTALILR